MGLFVHAQDHRVVGRIEVEADDVSGLARELGIGALAPTPAPLELDTILAYQTPHTWWSIDGLSVGLTRVFYDLVPDGWVPFGDCFLVLQGVRKSGFRHAAEPDRPGSTSVALLAMGAGRERVRVPRRVGEKRSCLGCGRLRAGARALLGVHARPAEDPAGSGEPDVGAVG